LAGYEVAEPELVESVDSEVVDETPAVDPEAQP
jgi:hypothetical protein